MEKKPLLLLVILLLGLSFLMSYDARVLVSGNLDPAGVERVDLMDQMKNRKMVMVECTSKRKEIGLNDYSESGANNRHDPIVPARS